MKAKEKSVESTLWNEISIISSAVMTHIICKNTTNSIQLILVRFPDWNQNTQHKQVNGGRTYFGSWFHRIQCMVISSTHLGRTLWWQEYLYLMADRKQSRGESQEPNNTPSDLFPAGRPTS
jgi:hypothetical protein